MEEKDWSPGKGHPISNLYRSGLMAKVEHMTQGHPRFIAPEKNIMKMDKKKLSTFILDYTKKARGELNSMREEESVKVMMEVIQTPLVTIQR